MQFIFGEKTLDLSTPQVMGILNVTPDSFSDGGRFNNTSIALQHATHMLEDGAAFIDIGGESTRPGAAPVSVQEELDRVIPLVEAIAAELDVLISVDTSTPEVISESAKVGAHLINDVRALRREGALTAAVKTGLPVCLMHMQGNPQTMQMNPSYNNVVSDVSHWLQLRADECIAAGIDRHQILLDPGFGFGKTTVHNYELLQGLNELTALGLPVLAGLSRKRMIGEVTAVDQASERMAGSVSGAVLCAAKGAQVIRVHDVKETVQALAVFNAMNGVMDV